MTDRAEMVLVPPSDVFPARCGSHLGRFLRGLGSRRRLASSLQANTTVTTAATAEIAAKTIAVTTIVATAATIGGTGPLNDVAQAAALRPVAGQAASQVFAIGLLGAALLAATVVPLSTAYAIAETGANQSAQCSLCWRRQTLDCVHGRMRLDLCLMPGDSARMSEIAGSARAGLPDLAAIDRPVSIPATDTPTSPRPRSSSCPGW